MWQWLVDLGEEEGGKVECDDAYMRSQLKDGLLQIHRRGVSLTQAKVGHTDHSIIFRETHDYPDDWVGGGCRKEGAEGSVSGALSVGLLPYGTFSPIHCPTNPLPCGICPSSPLNPFTCPLPCVVQMRTHDRMSDVLSLVTERERERSKLLASVMAHPFFTSKALR